VWRPMKLRISSVRSNEPFGTATDTTTSRYGVVHFEAIDMNAQRKPERSTARETSAVRTVPREDCDFWVEGQRIVQRARVERERLGLADLAAEHQAAANRAEIADRIPTVWGF